MKLLIKTILISVILFSNAIAKDGFGEVKFTSQSFENFLAYLRGDGDTTGRTPNFLNKFDMIRFQSGAVGLVLEDPTPSAAQASASGDIDVFASILEIT